MAQLKNLIVSGAARVQGAVYADSFVGDVTGVSDRATSDANGNNIANTYIKSLYIDNNGKLVATKGNNTDTTPILPTPAPQNLGFGFGTCSTASTTSEKAVVLSGYELVVNGMVAVKFDNDVDDGATLNINNKGAKPIYIGDSPINSGVIFANNVATFVYNGTYYYLISVDKGLETDDYGTEENYIYDYGEELPDPNE